MALILGEEVPHGLALGAQSGIHLGTFAGGHAGVVGAVLDGQWARDFFGVCVIVANVKIMWLIKFGLKKM